MHGIFVSKSHNKAAFEAICLFCDEGSEAGDANAGAAWESGESAAEQQQNG